MQLCRGHSESSKPTRAAMDSGTVLRSGRGSTPTAKALRRERIFARLRADWAYDEIAREERLTPRRVRQIVSEALQRQEVDDGSDPAMLQHARLDRALRLAAQARPVSKVRKRLALLLTQRRPPSPILHQGID